MTTVPEGAQLSDDGQWWWDGNDWQPVGPDAGGKDEPTAEFAFDNNGLWVSPDDRDNPDNHAVLHHDAGTQVSFLLWNVGKGRGSPTFYLYVDDQLVLDWRTTAEVEPGSSIGPDDDGFVHGCGRFPEGRHVFRAVVEPGHPGNDETTNEVDID